MLHQYPENLCQTNDLKLPRQVDKKRKLIATHFGYNNIETGKKTKTSLTDMELLGVVMSSCHCGGKCLQQMSPDFAKLNFSPSCAVIMKCRRETEFMDKNEQYQFFRAKLNGKLSN
jgi:hypothetical protein